MTPQLDPKYKLPTYFENKSILSKYVNGLDDNQIETIMHKSGKQFIDQNGSFPVRSTLGYSCSQQKDWRMPEEGERYIYPIALNWQVVHFNDLSNKETIYNIPANIIADCITNKCKIVMHQLWEGHRPMFYHGYILQIKTTYPELLDEHFIVVTSNLSMSSMDLPYHTVSIPYFQHLMQPNTYDIALTNIKQMKVRDKKYIMLSRRMAGNRLAMLAEMFDIVDEGTVGVAFVDNMDIGHNSFKNIQHWLQSQFPVSSQKFDDLDIISKLPLSIDDGVDVESNPVIDQSVDKFLTSSLHVVLETWFGSNDWDDNMFFSEKMFKPMHFLQPFVLLNQPNSLPHLKAMGYETFDKWIDESYDKELDKQKRLIKVSDTIHEFCKQTPEQVAKMMKDMLPVLEHNYHTLIRNQNNISPSISRQIMAILNK